MSKRVTSLLVGALAVVLLGAPAQAQKALRKKAGTGFVTQKTNLPLLTENGAQVDATKLTPEQKAKYAEFTQKVADKAQSVRAAGKKTVSPKWFAGNALDVRLNGASARQLKASTNAPHYAATETVDEHGVITSPAAGEHKFYTRTGVAYAYTSDGWGAYYQGGMVEIVEAENDVVYVKDIVSRIAAGTWVKGTKAGNTITVAYGQPLFYNGQYDATVDLKWGNAKDGIVLDPAKTDNFVFNIEGDVISLQGTAYVGYVEEGADAFFLGGFWSDDNSTQGGDCESVWTLDPEYAPATTDLVEVPAGLQTETWNTSSSVGIGTAVVGFDGNDVYVQGVSADFPTSWIKGTLDGTTVTFKKNQYLGDYSTYHIWASGTDGSVLTDFYMEYDAATKTLTALNDLLINAADDRIYYLTWIEGLVITNGEISEPAIATGEPVEFLPYTNGFDFEDEQAEFGIYDANNDGSTWGLYDNSYFRYTYNSYNNADDWLVSPAIKLEAGKVYRIAVDAWAASTSYPERVEVLLGAAPKASAFTQSVIPATDILWTSAAAQTLENENVAVAETGYYYVGIHAISDADEYALCVDNFIVEEGADPTNPAAVTSLAVIPSSETLSATITFFAPTTAINGEPLTENIAKISLLRDGVEIAAFENVVPGTPFVYVDDDAALTMGYHTYQVIPYTADGVGQKSEAIEVLIVAPVDAPFTADFSSQNIFDCFTVIDANADGRSWAWGASYGAYSSYTYEGAGNMDDWFISVPVKLEAGKAYNLVLNARVNSQGYTERFEAKVGAAPTVGAMTTTIIPATEVANTVAEDYNGYFSVAEDGIYYVGIHTISDEYQYYLCLNSLTIEAGLLPTAPSAPRLAVQPDPYGAPKSVVTVTAAWKDFSGNDLTTSLSRLDVYRDGQIIKTFKNVNPAQTKVFVDYIAGGAHSYQAVPYDQDGEIGQKSEVVKTFVGIDAPSAIDAIELADNGSSVGFSWNAVNTGVNGGYVNPAEVTYNVWSMQIVDTWLGQMLDYDQLLGTPQGVTSFEAPFNTDEGVQEYKYFMVEPENEAGLGEGAINSLIVGAPYELPLEESFEGNSLHYFWAGGNNTGLYISNIASDEDGVALKLDREADGEVAEFTSGKLNVNGAGNPTLLFDVFTGSADAKLAVAGSVNGGASTTLVADVPLTDEYTTVKVPLASLQGGRYAQVSFLATLPQMTTTEIDWNIMDYVYNWGDTLIIDNIRITDLYEYNLAAKVSAPKTVQAGEQAEVKVTVQNIGEFAAKNFTVKLFAGNEQLLNETVADELGSFKKKEFTATLATSIFDDPADIKLRAVVDYMLDLDDEDNTAEAVISVKQSAAPAPEDVKGEVVAEGVKLTWNAPSSAEQEVTDDVESYNDFDNGGLDADVHIGQIGEWTTYDGNAGAYGYGFNGIQSTLGNPGAWQVFNPAAISADLAASYGAHSGSKYFISSCVAEPEGNIADTDKWLISPALPGTAQTISFWVRELVADYGAEKYQVLYSTTDNKVESFQVLATTETTATEWEQVSFDLPAGTTYFAIRHISNDVWALLVDDITYTVGGGSVAQYNIWVDGETADQVPASQLTYTVEGGQASSSYAVSAVYANGKQSRPVVAVISSANQQPTGIETVTGNTEPADIYTIDGKLVRSQATDLRGLKGAYVINGQKVILK